jgi:hypothetical protein
MELESLARAEQVYQALRQTRNGGGKSTDN